MNEHKISNPSVDRNLDAEHSYNSNTDRLTKIIDPIPTSNYSVNIGLYRIEKSLKELGDDYGGFEYNPDFQRGRVWTSEQSISYMESWVKGTLGQQAKIITLNCPSFSENMSETSDLSGFVVLDGLQRLSSIIDFVNGAYTIFDGIYCKDLENSQFNLKTDSIIIQVFDFQYKRDLLKYYIAINQGGTVHTSEELDRVKSMLNSI